MDKINAKSIKKIMKSNPNIDKDLYRDGIKSIEKLRKLGVARSQFGLDLPYSQKLKHEEDDNLICKF